MCVSPLQVYLRYHNWVEVAKAYKEPMRPRGGGGGILRGGVLGRGRKGAGVRVVLHTRSPCGRPSGARLWD